MWRYFVGALAGILLVAGGVLMWQNTATAQHGHSILPLRLAAAASGAAVEPDEPMPDPPAATEKTREQKRFSRYDHDKDGKVSRDEFLAARRRAFAKLDLNGDGMLSFDEYSAKAIKRFADADANRDRSLDAAEFATTRVQRKTRRDPRCPPAPQRGEQEGTGETDRS